MLLREETVLNALSQIVDPVSGLDLVTAKRIKGINVKSNKVSFLI